MGSALNFLITKRRKSREKIIHHMGLCKFQMAKSVKLGKIAIAKRHCNINQAEQASQIKLNFGR